MLNITKNGTHLMVTSGAFRNFFEKDGYVIDDEAKIDDLSNEKAPEDAIEPETENEVADDESADQNEDADEEEQAPEKPEKESDDEDEMDDEDLLEKPLGEMSHNELNRFAYLKDIDLDGVANTNKAIRAAIKKALNE